MAISPDRLEKIDCSHGNPLFPMTTAANYAFRESLKDLHQYQFINGGRSEESVRRTLDKMSNYFEARGIKAAGYAGLPWTHMMPVGGGVTSAFNLILHKLAEDVAEENRHHNRQIKPAILMPVPTYGFFIDTAEALGFEIIKVERNLEDGGKLAHKKIAEAIQACMNKDIRLVAFFDSNPNNPTGCVRSKQETLRLGALFQRLNALYEQQEWDVLHERQKSVAEVDLGIFKRKPGHRWDGMASRINIIEDMVYDGLEYGDKKPFGFAQIEGLYNDCLTLFGLSKAGLANLRAAVIVGSDKKLYQLDHTRMLTEYFLSKPALHALEAYFNTDEPFAAQRRRHLDRMNDAHRFRGLLMKALINGIDTMDEVDDKDRRRLINTVMKETCKDRQAALKQLQKGIPGLRVLTTPDAGFFHLIDFNSLKGKEYSNVYVHYKRYSGMTSVEDSDAIADIFLGEQKLAFAAGGWMGLDHKNMVARFTFAMPIANIIEVTRRLQDGMKIFSEPQPKKTAQPVPH